MILEEFKKELDVIAKSLESNFQEYSYKVTTTEDEIILKYDFGSFRLRILFKIDDIEENISTFYFDIATGYTVVNYISGQIFYGNLKKEVIKVVKFFNSYIEYYN